MRTVPYGTMQILESLLPIEKMKSYLFTVFFVLTLILSCDNSATPESSVVNSNASDSLYLNSFRNGGNLLDSLKYDLQLMIVADKVLGLNEDENSLSVSSGIILNSLSLIQDIDYQLDLLANGDQPNIEDFHFTNTNIEIFNKSIRENFSFSAGINELVYLKPINIEHYKMNPIMYLEGQKIMISASVNYLLVQIIRDYKGFKRVTNG
jgi:hypothetical protein